MRLRTLAIAVMAAIALSGGGLQATSTPAAAASPKTVQPGVQMVTKGSQCTANFVFQRGGDTYLGYAAHCAADGSSTNANGCSAANKPHAYGTPVRIDGVNGAGTLAYSSWAEMQSHGESNANTCSGNDFALVRIDPSKVTANPDMPYWGGPTGTLSGKGTAGERVVGYGNSGLRLQIRDLKPKTGVLVSTQRDGWSHLVYLATPAIPGDSGSALLDDRGKAMGIASTIQVAPVPSANYYVALDKAMVYARNHGMNGLTLVDGGTFKSGALNLYSPVLGL